MANKTMVHYEPCTITRRPACKPAEELHGCSPTSPFLLDSNTCEHTGNSYHSLRMVAHHAVWRRTSCERHGSPRLCFGYTSLAGLTHHRKFSRKQHVEPNPEMHPARLFARRRIKPKRKSPARPSLHCPSREHGMEWNLTGVSIS